MPAKTLADFKAEDILRNKQRAELEKAELDDLATYLESQAVQAVMQRIKASADVLPAGMVQQNLANILQCFMTARATIPMKLQELYSVMNPPIEIPPNQPAQ